MWKPEYRRAADRRGLRYPSDLTDAEWALVEPAIPPAKRGSRRRAVNVREVLNAIFYVLSTGCHVWMAPDLQELSSCSTRSLAVMCPAFWCGLTWTAGPDGFRGTRPYQWHGNRIPLAAPGFSRSVGSTDYAITRPCPRKLSVTPQLSHA